MVSGEHAFCVCFFLRTKTCSWLQITCKSQVQCKDVEVILAIFFDKLGLFG